MPGFQSLPGVSNGIVTSVSCPDSSDCAAVGLYTSGSSSLAFTVDEAGGTWGQAQALSVPAAAAVSTRPVVDCWAAGDCTTTGTFRTSSSAPNEFFAATESGGAWGNGQPIPGIPAAANAFDPALSCAPAGECTIAGWYSPASAQVAYQEFTATISATGSTGTAQPLAAPYGQYKSRVALSCPQAGYCALAIDAPAGYLLNEASAATVTLKASTSTLTYGGEQSETLTATVTSPAGGTPAGTVTVTEGTARACVITLQDGSGSCTPAATALPGGFGKLTATYSGDASYVRATSAATVAVTVARAPAAVSFTFSPATVTYTSHSLTFTFAISVTSAAGTPPGSAGGVIGPYNLPAGTCPAPLTAGKATCTVSLPLTGGRYPVVANYGGSADFLPATSSTRYLTVARAKTSTSITLSRATITYGHENAEKLTVSASHLSGSYSTGKVTIKAGSTVLCTINLSKGAGSCILSASKLKAGTYHLAASYGGDASYAPSASAAKPLKVAA